MELTPIKIPGKSKGDYSKAGIAARKALKRPQGKRFKLPSSENVAKPAVALATTAKKAKKRTLKNIKSRRKMSLLEKLPTELLETVFLHCLNLDLPRSSPVIAGKLSSALIYSRTIMAAFGPTWDMWHGLERNRRSQEDSSDGDPGLQSAILRCRWANLDVLLKTKDAWLKRNAPDRAFIPLYFTRGGSQTSMLEAETPVSPKSAEEYFNIDFAGFCNFASEVDGPSFWHTCNWERNTDVSDGVEIPGGLLLGPWTDDMIKYLFWLVKSGAVIDWVNSTSGEAAISGLRTAILEGDTRAIHLLHWAGLLEKLETDTLIWALQNAGGDKQTVVNHILRLGFNILSDPDSRKLGRALSHLRDEGVEESDQEKLDFFQAVRKSRTLRDVTNLHV